MDPSKHHDAAVRPISYRDGNGSEELADFKADGSIPMKYRGTAADQRDMAVLGKKQVLRVRKCPCEPRIRKLCADHTHTSATSNS